jgi:hypothetical protein
LAAWALSIVFVLRLIDYVKSVREKRNEMLSLLFLLTFLLVFLCELPFRLFVGAKRQVDATKPAKATSKKDWQQAQEGSRRKSSRMRQGSPKITAGVDLDRTALHGLGVVFS